MATGLANTPGMANPPAADHSGERLIQSQLKRAGRYVKWVEAGSQLLTLLIATLIFFLAAALIDHWIISLGWFGRWLLCLTFVAGSCWFVATRLLPLLVRAVNPAYSAHAIEEATPTLKNSLLNFLLLQKDHAGVKQSVMHALESQAASDISTVEVETAIDRAPLIRMGYILCGVMAFVALYKIASPKDPFQTAARVVAPWADLARPSRVLIREVQPGHTSVYLGSQVEVSADVRGSRGQDAVRLVYTSADGQVTDRAIVMKNAGGNRFVATLPGPGSDQPMGRTGLQQGVQYHIEAGDAISSIYEIRVRMAPTIAVERAELNFPAYTLKPAQSQPTGEIKALEGTRVTIHARANQPIKSAFLELDPRPGRAAERIALQVDGQNASGGFTLQLKTDRVTPWRGTYQVRFTNEQGEISEQPVIHKLDVTPDLPPEVEILQPRLQKVDLAEDGRLTIEARGVDPDFALFDLHVAGKSPAGELFRKTLLPPGAPQSQASGKFDFVPANYNLKAGTVVTYQAIAVDNRRDPLTQQPQPGRAATAEYTINIIAPRQRNPNEAQNQETPNPNAQQNPPNDPQQQPQPGENRQPMKPGENPPNNPQQPPMPGENPMGENQPGENLQDNPQPNAQQPNNGNNNQPQPNKPQDKPNEGQNNQQQKPDSGQSGEGQGGQSTSGSGNNAQPGSGAGQPNNNSQPNNNQPMPQSGDPSGNSGNDPGNSQNQPNGNGGQPGGAQNQPGGQPGDPQGNPANPNQGGSDADPAGGNPNVREGSGEQSGKPQHDGEKFEKLLENLKKRLEEEKKKSEGGGQSTGQQSPNNSAQKPDGQTGQPGKPSGEQSAKDKETSEQLLKELEKMVQEQQAKDAREGKSPGEEKPQDQTAQNGQPMDQQQPGGTPMPGGQDNSSNNATGQKPPGGQQVGQPKPGEVKPGEPKPGQQGDPQNGAGPKPNEGGSPQGPPRNEANQPMPMPKPGDQKNPGAGENGNPREGGQQSKDPTGSAQGDQQAQDKPMQSKPGNEGGDPNTNEASPPGQSKKNSDTQGSTSGDQRGNGKQGPGQSGGAKGNDSAGKSSPGDEGAGRANEQGQGETGNKAGKGPEAAGKTGQPGGKQPGEGSETKPGEKGTESGKGGEPGKKPGEKGENEPGGSNGGGSQIGPGKPTGAGTASDQSGKGITNKSADAADEANLEYTRRVTDLVLQSLRDQEHNPDPELAKRNGLSPQELQEFARRWSQLKKDAENDPAKARELDEALRALGLRDPKNRRRSESSTDKQRDLRDAGGRTQAPSKYREQFDQFRKSVGGK